MAAQIPRGQAGPSGRIGLAGRIDLAGRVGGPVGTHARRRGIWFDPVAWALVSATVLWLLTLWRHKPCQQHVAGAPVNAFYRLCYSDIPVLYQTTGVGTGSSPLGLAGQNWPPLTAAFIAAVQWFSRHFGAHPMLDASAQQVVDGASVFFLVASVALFCCFLALVCCQTLLGSTSARTLARRVQGRRRSWEALLVAGSPSVLAAGLVSWDLFAVALTSAALLAWALGRRALAGVLFGLAISAGAWPVLVLLAVWLLCARAGLRRAALPTVGLAAMVVALVSGLAWWRFATPWLGAAQTWWRRGPDLGSLWYVISQAGVAIPAPVLSVAVAALMAAWIGWVALLVLRVAPRRPRLGQVAFLLVAGWLLLNKGYAPQQVLWLVPLVVLARPRVAEWSVWVVAEVLYWAAVWGHLGGMLSSGDGSPDVVYWAAIVFRVLVLGWLVALVAHDIRRPWEDPVRTPLVDDPIGGVLDHAPDVGRGDEPFARTREARPLARTRDARSEAR